MEVFNCSKGKFFAFILCLLFLFSVVNVWAGGNKDEDVVDGTGEVQNEEDEELEDDVIYETDTIVFPDENPNIIFVEGEDAVSTNFNKEPILNYSVSGSRTLQLNKKEELQGGVPYYSNFVFYADEPGTYELWYGGTPPGPKDELYPSFSSPMKFSIDNGELQDGYREDVDVVEEYAPSYYWNMIGDVEITEGKHNIQFEVNERRRFDSKFYFYIDCFFLVKKVEDTRVLGEPLPEVFPVNMDDRSINYPFRTIEDYQIIIRDNPDKIEPYIELSLIYTLLSDYLNAIKYLKRAEIYDPYNPQVMLLLAKNRIWRGDIDTGLGLYRNLLLQDPNNLDIWAEAGKIAAWTGRYNDSISFYEAGLDVFPDNFNLKVNLGFTYLWRSEEKLAEKQFADALETAGSDIEMLKALADVFLANGFPDKAAEVYEEAISLFPGYLELYLLLQEAYLDDGNKQRADRVKERIELTFEESVRLSRYLDIFYEKLGLKEQVIKGYEDRLVREPDNLELRGILAEAYFWNGLRDEAIREFLNILVNSAFRSFLTMDENSQFLYELMDNGYVYLEFFENFGETTREKTNTILAAQAAYFDAVKAYEDFLAAKQKADAAGESIPDIEQELQTAITDAQNKLSELVIQANILLELYYANYNSYTEGAKFIAGLQDAYVPEEESFQNLINSMGWEWDRNGFIAELNLISKEGLELADYVLGKIYQIEQQYSLAEEKYRSVMETYSLSPVRMYGLAQTMLWEKQMEEAAPLLNSAGSDLRNFMAHVPDLDILVTSLTVEKTLDSGGYTVSDSDIESILQSLRDAQIDSSEKVSVISENQGIMHVLMQNNLIRTMYAFEESTYLLRKELGDFYLADQKPEFAIRQYRQVLAIDPWDMSAVFRLGKVYEWTGDWKEAMVYYKKVYDVDPFYENVLSLYNNLARKYASSLSFNSSFLTEPDKATFSTEALMTHPINTFLGWSLRYENEVIRKYAVWDDVALVTLDPYTYMYNLISVGVPIDIYFLNWKITPWVGLNFWNELDENQDAPTPGFSGLWPHLQLDTSVTIARYLYIYGTFQWGRYAETIDPLRNEILSLSMEGAILLDFGFTGIYPFKISSVRLFGDADILNDSNIIYSGGLEYIHGLVDREDPDLYLALIAKGLYESSADDEGSPNYYAPHKNVIAGGGIKGTLWLGLPNERTLGISMLALGSAYLANVTTDAITKSFKLEAELGLEFINGDSTYTLGVNFSDAFVFSPDATNLSATEGWDYWSMDLKFGFSARLPKLLSP